MKRRFALFAMAFLVALASTGAVFLYVSKVDARAVADQQPVKVLVAKQRIPAGTKASAAVAGDLAELKTFARGSVPDGALGDAEEVAAEQVALADFFPGEVLLAAKFGEEAPASGPLTIPDGKLAVSVTLEDPQSVAGFVTPGAEVAIFDTFNVFPVDAKQGQTPSGDRLADTYGMNRATRLVLARSTVLAVGTDAKTGRASEDESAEDTDDVVAAPVESVTLTLAVTQAEAEKVILAAETGALWFGLLSDTSTTAPSQGVDSRRLFD